MLEGDHPARGAQPFSIRSVLVFSHLLRVKMLPGGTLQFTFILDGGTEAVYVFMDRNAVIDAAKEALLTALGLRKLMVKKRPQSLH